MANIDQIQITFAAEEDRLLLRVSTRDGAEFRFWLTRRYVKALRALLGQSLARQPRIQTQASAAARQALLQFEHERVVQKADFATPYRASEKHLPLGPQPALLARMQVTPRADGAVLLALAPASGSGIDLALSPTLLHSFVALIEQALAAADWELAPAPATTGTPRAQPASLN